jgi:putative FmdB family regulatory protein
MPIYEYRCEGCGKRQSFLVSRIGARFRPVCRFCGGRKLVRLISRVAVLGSEESRLERLADPSSWGDLDERDPRSVARFVKKMGEAMGEDLGDEVEQALEEVEGSEGGGEDREGAE